MDYFYLKNDLVKAVAAVEGILQAMIHCADVKENVDSTKDHPELYAKLEREMGMKQAQLSALVVEHKDMFTKAFELARAAELLGFEKGD